MLATLTQVPRLAVGVFVFDAAGRVLLIERGRAPGKGLWSVPGGKVEWGEAVEDACRREVLEETGVEVTVGPLVTWIERMEGSLRGVGRAVAPRSYRGDASTMPGRVRRETGYSWRRCGGSPKTITLSFAERGSVSG